MNYQKTLEHLKSKNKNIIEIGRSGLATAAHLAVDIVNENKPIVIIAKNRDEISTLRSLINLFTPEISSGGEKLHIPRHERTWTILQSFSPQMITRDAWANRLASLYALRHGLSRAVLLSADNFIMRHIPLDFFTNQEITLKKNEELSPDTLIEQCISWGYKRVSMVSAYGELARRGDILDIFPPGYEKAVRIEFFGDFIEEIRLFDPNTQRSINDLDEATILTVNPVRQDKISQKKIIQHIETLFQQGRISEFEQNILMRELSKADNRLLPALCYENSTTIEEWLPKDASFIMLGKNDTLDAMQRSHRIWNEHLNEDEELGQALKISLRNLEEIKYHKEHCGISIEPMLMGIQEQKISLQERHIKTYNELFPKPEAKDRPWQSLVQALKEWQKEHRQIILSFNNERSRAKFLKLSEQDGILPNLRYDKQNKGIFALIAHVQGGFNLSWDNALVLGENILQPSSQERRAPAKAFKGLDKHDDLEEGSLLVHRDYGIARFIGLVRLDLNNTSNDFLLLHYAGEDKLYVPVDRLSLMQKFKGEGNEPALDKLGSSAWQTSKEKARKAIEKIAQDLVEMYAWRKIAKGFKYDPPNELYREFEASFGFEETPDQAKAINDVLNDMEKSEPMDRLVCGDVGFGKTEVALRAAFRAACEGRQVAMLCPTTILAEQHYQTFRSRLSNFAINVGLLSRFVSRQKQKEVLASAATGQIDILIGTHRLLSEDVKLPNLALMILDEEQRFGVRHKEKLKNLKKNIDALTLTATPIPRTLQLSMSGIRELSVIETAPPERKPVATAIVEREDKTLQGFLERELARKGQIFWVYNRVQGLERVVEYVQKLVPNAKIGMAHGQMSEKELEDNMHKFWHGEIDILVCTAIVESGLDFPRANTLIVDQAQMFGLGQLYQLRGRVGRSDQQAYAVFVVKDLDSVPEKAKERLRIILELDYLGAGFAVAMEDLRVRGAGNILGEVQSGHMARVGLELFLEMLEQAVSKLKDGSHPLQLETELNINVTAHIPEAYIKDSKERLHWYKLLSSAPDANIRQDRELELRDIYGPLPDEVLSFIGILALKEKLSAMQALKADIFAEKIKISWNEKQNSLAPEKLISFIKKNQGIVKLSPPANLEIKLDANLSLANRLDQARSILHNLA